MKAARAAWSGSSAPKELRQFVRRREGTTANRGTGIPAGRFPRFPASTLLHRPVSGTAIRPDLAALATPAGGLKIPVSVVRFRPQVSSTLVHQRPCGLRSLRGLAVFRRLGGQRVGRWARVHLVPWIRPIPGSRYNSATVFPRRREAHRARHEHRDLLGRLPAVDPLQHPRVLVSHRLGNGEERIFTASQEACRSRRTSIPALNRSPSRPVACVCVLEERARGLADDRNRSQARAALRRADVDGRRV